MISEPMVRLAQTVHLSWVKIRTISKRNKTSFHLSFVTTKYHRVRSKRYLSLWYIWRKPCTYVALTLTPSPNGSNEIPHDPCQLGVPSGASKMISEPMVCSQTVHLYCTNTNTISKRTERDSSWSMSTRSSIGFVQNDIWAYGTFSQIVHLSYTNTNSFSKWTERDSTWPTSPRSSIGCV